LKEEGLIRELIRQIQDMRKEANFTRHHKMQLRLESKDKSAEKLIQDWEKTIEQGTLSKKFMPGSKEIKFDLEKELVVGELNVKAAIKKDLRKN